VTTSPNLLPGDISTQRKKDQVAAIATIQRAERRARCFRKFHNYTKPPRSPNGLAYVIRTDENGDKTRIQQPTELHATLFERNRKHFAQADGTPITRPPLSSSLNFSGISTMGERILNGNIPNDTLTQSTTAILAELRRVRPPLAHQMTIEDMMSGFSKWRKSTTTSPSNKHLGI
jgi:hypothetical protein